MSIWVSSTLDCSVLEWRCSQHCCQIQHFVNNQKIVGNDIFLVVYKMLDLATMLQLPTVPPQNTAVKSRTNSSRHPSPQAWHLLCNLDPISVGTTSSTEVIHVVDEMDTPTQEQHWGEILERTVSKQNLMLVNVGTNGTILNHQQTFPRFYKVEPIETKAVITFTIQSKTKACLGSTPIT